MSEDKKNVLDAPLSANLNAATLPSSEVAALSAVKLPGFWQHSPRQWFVHADAVFANHRVTASSARVNHVVASLDEHGIRAVMDILGPHASYESLKQRLIEAYDVPSPSRFREMVTPGGMGDRRPSQLLREMRNVLPEGTGDAIIKEFWMQKLPSNVQTSVATLEGPLDVVAVRADRIYQYSQDTRQVDAVQATTERVESLEATVLALSRQLQERDAQDRSRSLAHSRGNSYSRGSVNTRGYQVAPSRGRQNTQPPARRSPSPFNRSYCYYHNRYGEDAFNCRPPCAFAIRGHRDALN